MKWITRERARVDRIACPWLIARFIDPTPEFLFVPATQVREIAARESATRTTSRTSSSATTARSARSMPSSSGTSWRIRGSPGSRASCGAPTPTTAG